MKSKTIGIGGLMMGRIACDEATYGGRV